MSNNPPFLEKVQSAASIPLFATLKDDLHAALFELIGTAFFLLLGLGGIQAAVSESAGSISRPASTTQQVLYDSTAMGFSLLVSAWLFFRVTGGLFNPNVSLALLLVGVIRPVRFVLYCVAQLVGAIVGAALVDALTTGELAVNTFLQVGVNRTQGVFIEMFMTSALVLAVLMLAAEKHQATPFAPIGIGLTLFVTHLFAVYYTGASINTARSFGPAVVTGFKTPNHWVYWVGPFLGSLLGSGFYMILKHYRYWRLNPDQATVDSEKSPRDPVQVAKKLMTPRVGARATFERERERDARSSMITVVDDRRIASGSASASAVTMESGEGKGLKVGDSAV